jgi:hypothetical protein
VRAVVPVQRIISVAALAHHMGKTSRGVYYFLAPAIIVTCAVGQWVMGREILINGGYLAG